MVVDGYNKWLEEHLEETEAVWAKLDRSEVIAAIEKYEPLSVIEFCCGTGWIPKGLNDATVYRGIDANWNCLAYARKKNPEVTRKFTHADVREIEVPVRVDMAVAFSCLKHFTLVEWDGVYAKVLQSGKRTLTSIFMSSQDEENERHGFPHTSVTLKRVERVMKENGHRLVQIFTLPPISKEPEPLVLTELIDASLDVYEDRIPDNPESVL